MNNQKQKEAGPAGKQYYLVSPSGDGLFSAGICPGGERLAGGVKILKGIS